MFTAMRYKRVRIDESLQKEPPLQFATEHIVYSIVHCEDKFRNVRPSYGFVFYTKGPGGLKLYVVRFPANDHRKTRTL